MSRSDARHPTRGVAAHTGVALRKWQCNDVESQDDDETFDADVLEDGAADS